MGADSFEAHGTGETIAQAFNQVVDNAQYEYGHGGYSGTIAEKSSYVLAGPPPDGFTLDDMPVMLMLWDGGANDRSDVELAFIEQHGATKAQDLVGIYHDKWESAVAFNDPKDPHAWMFCGYASS